MTHASLNKTYNVNWDTIIEECDQNGDGQIDFQEFMSACINRKALMNQGDVKIAFNILDENNDGQISLEDFNDIFCSYGGAKMDNDVWQQLLQEADRNYDGAVSEGEFTNAMSNMIRKGLSTIRMSQIQK